MTGRSENFPSPPGQRGQIGTTLIEVMAASLLISLTFTAVITSVRQSRDLEYNGNAYAQARRIANSILERARYHHSRYADIPPDSTYPAADRPVIHVSDVKYIDTNIRIQATETTTLPTDWYGGTALTYKRILVTITWNNGADSVKALKWITQG